MRTVAIEHDLLPLREESNSDQQKVPVLASCILARMMESMLMFPPELLTRKLTAYMLSTSEWGVSQLVRENKLTPVDDGGKWQKFLLEDVREYARSLPHKNSE